MRLTNCITSFKSQMLAVISAFQSSHWSTVPVSSCSLSSLLLYHFPVFVHFELGHPCLRNFNTTILVDVISAKSEVDSFIDPTCVPVRISIIKLTADRIEACLVGVFSNGKKFRGGLRDSTKANTWRPILCDMLLSQVCLWISSKK